MLRILCTPLKRLSINQMLFGSHLVLVLFIVVCMSYSRYVSEWNRHVSYSALLAEYSIKSHINFFSSAVAGLNYANLTMSSTKQLIASMEDILYFEVSGVSDYSKRPVKVQYLAATQELWRADVTQSEVNRSFDTLLQHREALLSPDLSSPIKIRKLNYLLNRSETEYEALSRSFGLTQSFQLPWQKPKLNDLHYQLDQEDCVLHVQVPLTNVSGGYIWAVIDASKLTQIQHALIKELLIEAISALFVSMFLILWVSHWIVAPLKKLAASMRSEHAYQEINSLSELQRTDEIGQLARAYRGLLVKIESQLNILRTKSDTDPLTGLGSRYKYTRTALPFIKRHVGRGEFVGMIVCDVDNFKSFNDIYGHTEGDNALAKVGNKIAELARDSDLAFRYGGEEFVILCARPSESQLYYFTERLKLEIEGLGILHAGNMPYRVVTVSTGGTIAHHSFLKQQPLDHKALQEHMFNVADKALYRSKEQGRNHVNWRAVDMETKN